nr:peptidylprolyl isomerase [Oscillospiraceae bacterium]
MSASSKKKLRKEQEAAKLTERQQAAQKEAKITKLYTIAFVVAMVVILVIAVTVGVSQFISNSGIREKNTTALTIGEHKLSNAELNYFYVDAINSFYSQNGQYASFFGLDTTLPLDEQLFDETTGQTWADYFVESAKTTAKAVYAMNDAAAAAGHTLSEEEASQVDSIMSNFSLYASLYGYNDGETYLKAMYGRGASEKGMRNYLEKSLLADSYKAAHQESLTYEDADLRAAEAENYDLYSSYTYNYYYLSTSRFLEGGTTDEEGNTTYTDEEKAASVTAAEEAAKSLLAAEITSVADLDAAIAAMPINAESGSAKSTAYTDNPYAAIDEELSAWLSDNARKEGDIAYIANTDIVTNDDGTETTETRGFYVVYFISENDNAFALKNARHILVSFEGGTTDENGATTYSEEEKAAAKTAAEEILNQWQSGEATEDSFAALATEKTDDTGSAANGGLYENIYPGQMVAAFEDWCYDEGRAAGDTGIVETEYGYHVMYFVGNSDTTYRDFQIRNELSNADHNEWYTGIVEAASVTEGDTSYLSRDIVLAGN